MIKKISIVAALSYFLTGCATGLNPSEKIEYRTMESKGIAVTEKSPATGAWLGILPGGGSFYAEEPGFGVLNLLLWPVSIFWDPVSGYEGSEKINYQVSKVQIIKIKQEQSKKINRELQDGVISSVEAKRQLEDLEDKYSY